VEININGSAGGHGKRTRGNPGSAPVPDPTAAAQRRSCQSLDLVDHRWSPTVPEFWNPTGHEEHQRGQQDRARGRPGPGDRQQQHATEAGAPESSLAV
jgi:hypothetical protein